ncbi:mitogen-activated protein kinase kinase kinase [Trifolium repens]|nr:mitogen-activated protein kinase kinase kinase [Trifolium repens]
MWELSTLNRPWEGVPPERGLFCCSCGFQIGDSRRPARQSDFRSPLHQSLIPNFVLMLPFWRWIIILPQLHVPWL